MYYKVVLGKIFQKNIKSLKKDNPKINKDVLKLVSVLSAGDLKGSPIKNNVYKVRIRNSDNNKGKSGGYRVIYYVLSKNKIIHLLAIYSKSYKESISENEIMETLKEEELL